MGSEHLLPIKADRIRLLASATVLAATTALLTHEILFDTDKEEFQRQDQQEYQAEIDYIDRLSGNTLASGDTLDWIAKVSVDGWKADISPSAGSPSHIPSHHPDKVVFFSMSLLDGANPRYYTITNASPKFEENETVALSPYIEKPDNGNNDGTDTDWVLQGNEIRLEIYTRKGSDEESSYTNPAVTVEERTVTIDLDWYSGAMKHTGTVARTEANSVVSELPLANPLHQSVKQKALYYRDYLVNRDPIVVVHNSDEPGGQYDEALDVVHVNSPNILPGETTIDHEFAHAMLEDLISHDEATPIIKEYERQFQDLIQFISSPTDPGDSCAKDYSVILQMFDESTYEGDDCAAGHPGDSAHELFASAFTILKYHPDALTKRYRSMNEAQQSVARPIIESVLRLLDHQSEYANLPPLISESSPLRSIS